MGFREFLCLVVVFRDDYSLFQPAKDTVVRYTSHASAFKASKLCNHHRAISPRPERFSMHADHAVCMSLGVIGAT
jgi:hypothetical protein